MITSNITYNTHYNGHSINTDEIKGLGCHSEILYRINMLFDYALHRHPAVLFFTFNLHYPQDRYYPSDNSILSSFLAYYVQKLKDKDPYLNPLYLWTRECKDSKHHHYHSLWLLNKDRTQNEYGHIMLADKMWQDKLCLTYKPHSGLLDFCNKDRIGNNRKNGIIINRNSFDFKSAYNFCFWRASYATKISSKGNSPYYLKEFGSSLIPRDFQLNFNINQGGTQ